jgi:prepilin-type N-terminal cleavage/methylation domain-containing protein
MVKNRSGFTLIELIITIVIMALMVSGLFAMLIFGWNAVTDMGTQRRQVDNLRYFRDRIERDLRGITKHGFVSSSSSIVFYVWKNYPGANSGYYLCRYIREGSEIVYYEQRVDDFSSWNTIKLPTGTPSANRQVVLSDITEFTISPAIASATLAPIPSKDSDMSGDERAYHHYIYAKGFRRVEVKVTHVQKFDEAADLIRSIRIVAAPRNLVYYQQEDPKELQPAGATINDYNEPLPDPDDA